MARLLRQGFLCLNRTLSSKTHFGYETVPVEEKSRLVYGVFEKVADSYDVMNDIMSFGVHRLWKDRFVDILGPPDKTDLLDVAGGTGDIAFRVMDYLKNKGEQGKVTVCDINKDMLRVGESRAERLGYELEWVEGDAQKLPFPDSSFTAYTIAFGIRNVTDINLALIEAFRVLKPGGRFLCLEFSRVNAEILKQIYDLYSFQVIPVMGQLIAGDWKSYQYLVESIRQFPDQETFKKMIQNAGFSCVTYEDMTFGVVSVHSGFKL